MSYFLLFPFTGPQDVPLVYCLFYFVFVPLRWIYYRFKKWHYYLLVINISQILILKFNNFAFVRPLLASGGIYFLFSDDL